LTPDEEREACRALKGSMLRQEKYALDNTQQAQHPYTVAEQNLALEQLQPKGENRHAVFFTHPSEAITYHYERNPADPRVQHAITLEVDGFGNVLKSVAIGYGRRRPDLSLRLSDQPKQTQSLITCTDNRVTNAINSVDDFRTPVAAETRTYELTGYETTSNRFQAADFVGPDPLEPNRLTFLFDSELQYEQQPSTGRQRRLIEQVRTLYRSDDLGALGNDPDLLLPLAQVQARALIGESYKLAFTPGLLGQVFRRNGQALLPTPANVLGGRGAEGGGYVDLDGDGKWWIPSGRVFMSPNPNHGPTQELNFARRHFLLPHRYRDAFHTNLVSTENIVTYDAHNILMLESHDPLGNRLTVGERLPNGDLDTTRNGNDYRVLQPFLLMDANRNRSAVAFDALGMVVGTALMGKPEETVGDSLLGFETDLPEAAVLDHLRDPLANPDVILGSATTRMLYDLFAYQRSRAQPEPQPSVVYTISRETHAADLVAGQQTKVQHNFTYSDGFGREIQKKVQAEAGPVPRRDTAGRIMVRTDGTPVVTTNDVSPRWVGSGWTIFNNKGKPVRQYEPFFSDTHHFDSDVRIGVSPVLFYDPVERVVATLHPNRTWEKVVFGPWRQETWDVSDTVLVSDPKTDPDVGDFFKRLPDADYLPTWHTQRDDGTFGAQEQDAARKAAVYADTPTVTHADSLGRAFLTIVRNKFKFSNAPPGDPPLEEVYETRTILDIEGNQREVVDPKDRTVMRYDCDMLANRIHQASMEAGEHWVLNDVASKPLQAWDSRDHHFRTAYDSLRRPTGSFLREGAAPERLTGRSIYGETQLNPEAANLRGKVVQLFDQSGVTSSDGYDFKGNLLRSRHQLAQSYKTTLDWSAVVPREPEVFTSRTRYDALNRPIQLIAPHSDRPGSNVNIIEPLYNEANLLNQVHVWLNQTAEPVTWLEPTTANLHAVTNINYNTKGQRELIEYGNGAVTIYEYEPSTFRLTHVKTTRSGDRVVLQDLTYTYDPSGNITHIRDDAQQTIYFRNRRVEPSSDYTYDAVYRLIEASGREHLGQAGAPIPHSYSDALRVQLPHPGDGNAMGTYLERYTYDEVGNFLAMQHQGSDPINPGWTRVYSYNEGSLLEPGQQSNRLSSTNIGTTTETYSILGNGFDAHGNMLRMPHLQVMQWDFKDQLQMTQRQAVNAEDTEGVERQGERTFYVYDSAGERVRRVTESSTGQIKEERIYLAGFELYRRNGVNPLVRETLHLMDDKQRIGLVETRTQGSDPSPQQLIRFQLSNHLGSATLELDDQSQIISYEEYSPYGSTIYQAVRSQTETPKRYRYTGKERDEETGLSYHSARYYAPWLGKWTRPDEIAPAAANRYEYGASNPVRFVDQTGLYEEPVHGATTYQLALAAGFQERDAARLALATAAVDHDPTTVPERPQNIRSGVTARYHFPSFYTAQQNVEREIDRGQQMSLRNLGVALHALEDVGFREAPGPHSRRTTEPIVVFPGEHPPFGYPGMRVIPRVQIGPWRPLGTPDSEHQNIGAGHPFYITERGEISQPLNRVADQAFQDPIANTRQLSRIYQVLQRAANEYYGFSHIPDDSAARAAIAAVTSADTDQKVRDFLNERPTISGSAYHSYAYWVDYNDRHPEEGLAQAHWPRGAIDTSVPPPPPPLPRVIHFPDGSNIDTQTGHFWLGPGPKF
jgi:RHS repeat-associated protein